MKIKYKKNHKTAWLITVIVVVATVLCTSYFLATSDALFGPRDETSSKSSSNSSDESSEPQDTNPSHKLNPSNTDRAVPTTDESSGRQVVPVVANVVVDGNTVFIRGGTNVSVNGGSCFAILHGPNGEQVRKDTSLLPNSSTTDCKTIQIPISELSAGTWTFTLNYLSDSVEGTSSVTPFTI